MGALTWIVGITSGLFAVGAGLFLKYPWLKYDFMNIYCLIKAIIYIKGRGRKNELLIDIFEGHVKTQPGKTFLIYQGKKFTYKEINTQANKVAQLAQKLGWNRNDLVALLIYNEPAFIWTYLGLMKVGVQMPLLNFNLRSKSLLHCVQVNKNLKGIIIGQGDDLQNAILEILPEFGDDKPKIYVQGTGPVISSEFLQFDELIKDFTGEHVDRNVRSAITIKDRVSYIYTSGTTGLPKAAVITHLKAMKGACLMSLSGTTSSDIIYTPLPLYHSAAGLIALGAVIKDGATLVLRSKFSASNFLEDCRQYNVTVVQYIGELCRYLLAQPKSDRDKDHKIWLAFGNGMRKDIFDEFRERFGILKIGEFYAATEGNAGFINTFNKTGSIGRLSPFLSLLSKCYLVKYNFDTAEPERCSNGFCYPVKQGEQGLVLSKIKANQEYDGYQGNKELSERKIVRNVFQKGDSYFNTGDLLVQDEEYFVYFSDRIGDTFRWKGENVSTIEVSNVMADLDWIEDANVYGVEVPGQDGRCGMASLNVVTNHNDVSEDNLKSLYKHCEDLLPVYARPRFLRIQNIATLTATFKQQKVTLVKQGFNPDLCNDDMLYCINPKEKSFMLLDKDVYERIKNGEIRL